MRTMRSVAVTASVAGLTTVLGAAPALAHNAAHLYVNGTCVDVGSSKNAPLVGSGAPQTSTGQLDLISDPNPSGVDTSDQFGARFAANVSPVLLPGNC